jgi:hypothetical protein
VPAANPFAPLIDVSGGATAGPASVKGGGSLSLGNTTVGDHHISAAVLLGALVVLVLLHKGRFRFSTKVG